MSHYPNHCNHPACSYAGSWATQDSICDLYIYRDGDKMRFCIRVGHEPKDYLSVGDMLERFPEAFHCAKEFLAEKLRDSPTEEDREALKSFIPPYLLRRLIG